MAHLALYRKYRPTTFSQLVGQPAVSKTLSRALVQDRLAHAYLFCGPRGTGKTSVARILARGLLCEQGPTPNPCGVCASCEAISEGRHLDVVEMDAASHNGVDHVRELQDRVALAPIRSHRKIYIVDEVHMLSTGAFNALLKTLEEPPTHVIFVLATTDPHKVLPTIVSRCQRFDFGRIPLADLVSHMAWVLAEEGKSADNEALDAIARRAQGGLRDALSLLDQVMAVADGPRLGAAEVASALGLADGRQVAAMALAVLQRDAQKALNLAQNLQAAGQEAAVLLRELAAAIRHALVLSLAPKQAQALEVPQSMVDAFGALSPGLSLTEGAWLTEALQEAEKLLRTSPQAGAWLDLTLLRLAGRPETPSLLHLQERVAALEARWAHSSAPDAPTQARAGSHLPSAAPTPRPLSPAPPALPVQNTTAAPALDATAVSPPKKQAEASQPPSQSERTQAPEDAADLDATAPEMDQELSSLGQIWDQLLAWMLERNKATGELLKQKATPLRLDAQSLVIKLDAPFQQLFQRQTQKKQQLNAAIAEICGPGIGHRFVLSDEAGTKAPTPTSASPTTPSQARTQKLSAPTAAATLASKAPAAPKASTSPPATQPEGKLAEGHNALAAPLREEAPPAPLQADPIASTVTVSGEATEASPMSQEQPAGDADAALRLAVQHFKGRVRRHNP